MRILGIETSCDETAAAVVEARGALRKPRFRVLSNIVSSQVKLHAKYGGVVPALAAREHEKNLPIVTNLALKKGGVPLRNIDLIAVTKGPGLMPSLLRGIRFSKALARNFRLPILGVNHLEGHIYSNWLGSIRTIKFPAICLIISGGHTELILMKGHGRYRLLGATRDDAVGEAYDKVARLLGLGFPGGPAIDAIASRIENNESGIRIALPRPMLHTKDYDFSFAGLKTAVRYLLRDLEADGKPIPRGEIAAEFQAAVIEVLAEKTFRASREYRAKTIMVSGGVSANSALRRAFGERALFPPKAFTTDNAAMIAAAAYIEWLQGRRDDIRTLDADANLEMPYIPQGVRR